MSLEDIDGAQFTAIDAIAAALRAAIGECDDFRLVTLNDEREFSAAGIGETVTPNLLAVLIRKSGEVVGGDNSSVCSPRCIDMHLGDRRGVFGNSFSDIHRADGP